LLGNVPIRTPAGGEGRRLMSTEKYFFSNEDLIIYDVEGRRGITEQMSAYPVLDLSAGDGKREPFDPYAIFAQDRGEGGDATIYGVEICLDHVDTRLRSNLDNPGPGFEHIDVQIIPSEGMWIVKPSVAVGAGGYVFNCDGLAPLNAERSGQGVIEEVDCIFANLVDPGDARYGGHTQLARVDEPAIGGDPQAPRSRDASFATLDPKAITIVGVEALPGIDRLFAAGPGELHIYGLDDPYPLP
jgi:hypothetical protein